MVQDVIKIGNSKGIRIPAVFLKELHIQDKVEVKIVDGSILVQPVKTKRRGVRQGWKEAYASAQPEELLLPDVMVNRFDQEEWTW